MQKNKTKRNKTKKPRLFSGNGEERELQAPAHKASEHLKLGGYAGPVEFCGGGPAQESACRPHH